MTTLKDYKAMIIDYRYQIPQKEKFFRPITSDEFADKTANIAPELIRVIELADKALTSIAKNKEDIQSWVNLAEEALSEIRKLKGE